MKASYSGDSIVLSVSVIQILYGLSLSGRIISYPKIKINKFPSNTEVLQ